MCIQMKLQANSIFVFPVSFSAKYHKKGDVEASNFVQLRGNTKLHHP